VIRTRGERGVTLLEVTITTSLLLVVTGAVLSLLDTFTRAEARLDDRSDTAAAQRLALGEVAKDLRATSDLQAPSASADLSRRMVATVEAGDGPIRVTWEITDSGELRRSEDGHDGRPTRTVLADLDPERSTFTYIDATGHDLVPGRDSADRISWCAARVGLRVSGDGNRTESGWATRSIEIAPRNLTGGTSGC
jgi:type II secretory pathway pseudopilin PulG